MFHWNALVSSLEVEASTQGDILCLGMTSGVAHLSLLDPAPGLLINSPIVCCNTSSAIPGRRKMTISVQEGRRWKFSHVSQGFSTENMEMFISLCMSLEFAIGCQTCSETKKKQWNGNLIEVDKMIFSLKPRFCKCSQNGRKKILMFSFSWRKILWPAAYREAELRSHHDCNAAGIWSYLSLSLFLS